MAESRGVERFKVDFESYLSENFPGENVELMSEYAAVLVQAGKSKDELKADFAEVMNMPDAATTVSEWICNYTASAAPPVTPQADATTTHDEEDMVINLDVRSDEELDDQEQHPRRETRGNPAHLLVRAVQEAADDVRETRSNGRKRGRESSRDTRRPLDEDEEASTEGLRASKLSKMENGQQEGDENVTFTVTVDGSAGRRPGNQLRPLSTPSETTPTRCTYWPHCKRGSNCVFWHPTQPCRAFPSCPKGNQCLYVHPTDQYPIACKFGVQCMRPGCSFTHPPGHHSMGHAGKPLCRFDPNCTKPGCPFLHKSLHKNGSVNVFSMVPGKTPSTEVTSGTVCKFEPFCQRPNCAFQHPSRSTPIPVFKSKKFVETVEKDSPSMGQPSGNNGRWKNKSVVFNKPHISERSFALPEDDTEKMVIDGGSDKKENGSANAVEVGSA
ncbi:uncharacterized protein SPPG_07051 [Spizellomyces punctatus DAOM BR117]|uniref:C3H1-type domain-containing protein n=1 Tax=Spizellomyces punctatus (strain DAOM BR117) TaxID=645134 RepID=A0A0L0H9K6_SPIPD|nr:uncharacterized protein SPPG_07051 [Spizellomyces punctatus DAOM BR117]KNC97579.1 hypothetical protein SPPG_07051 [Spizellomyces punctatus DAOM BR117]|eukprot:XP_016605619.1 hypothetical protein SPPG_07051 [Spizellomyces punctatus DAOM BR117]